MCVHQAICVYAATLVSESLTNDPKGLISRSELHHISIHIIQPRLGHLGSPNSTFGKLVAVRRLPSQEHKEPTRPEMITELEKFLLRLTLFHSLAFCALVLISDSLSGIGRWLVERSFWGPTMGRSSLTPEIENFGREKV